MLELTRKYGLQSPIHTSSAFRGARNGRRVKKKSNKGNARSMLKTSKGEQKLESNPRPMAKYQTRVKSHINALRRPLSRMIELTCVNRRGGCGRALLWYPHTCSAELRGPTQLDKSGFPDTVPYSSVLGQSFCPLCAA